MARKAAVRYPDFTIVFRKDRNGFEGWFGGKAEAFRKTAEKVDAFFQKKYAKNGTLVDNVRVYNLPAEPVVVASVTVKKHPSMAKSKEEAKTVIASVKAKPARKAPKVIEFEPETFESEERLDHSDLDALL